MDHAQYRKQMIEAQDGTMAETNDVKDAIRHFAQLPTWTTGHPLDLRRFYLAIDGWAGSQAYDGDQLARWLEEFASDGMWPGDERAQAITRLVDRATAVHEYLRATERT